MTARTKKNAKDFDWDESVIYFMVTDRFFDGNESNNTASGAQTYGKDNACLLYTSYRKYLGEYAGQPCVWLAHKVCVTQEDIRGLQLAKAAFAAGMRILLQDSHTSYEPVSYTHLDVYKRQMLLLVLLVPYIFHYYTLENETQKMYAQYDEIIKHTKKVNSGNLKKI